MSKRDELKTALTVLIVAAPDPSNGTSQPKIEIRAPNSGVIVERNIIRGSRVRRNDRLFQIADLSQLMVMANLREEDLSSLTLPLEKHE